ncbi:hypothetical protein H3H32_08180 [Spirosoma foliorum]|uniref:ELWxxDGT repeat-containing protein n=2 Tax=Spirosoma foliorum TaxID=2710596 RepID=A0A7G5H6Z1_9BACT|nr:hypothetical protein H3H32_08180 [Spirosoma foliorum]
MLLFLCLVNRLPAQTLIKDIQPGAPSSKPNQLINVNGTLFFVADDGKHGAELWKSTGTTAGTTLVKDLIPGPAGSDINEMTAVNGKLFFSALSPSSKTRQLWVSSGFAANTVIPYDGHKEAEVQDASQLTGFAVEVYYVKRGSLGGTDQWLIQRSDGSPSGTKAFLQFGFDPVKEGKQPPAYFTYLTGATYFTYKGDLWRTNGQSNKTSSLVVKAGIYPRFLVNYGSSLLFVGGSSQSELWISQGTEASTKKLLTPAGGGAKLYSLTRAGKYVFFSSGPLGKEVWITDGTSQGTKKLATISGPIGKLVNLSSPNPFQLGNYKTYFTTAITKELYFTDGKSVTKVTGPFTGPVISLVNFKESLYFTTASGLFRTSNTQAVPIFTSSVSSSHLTDVNGRLFFSHNEPASGIELYGLGPFLKPNPFLKGAGKASQIHN